MNVLILGGSGYVGTALAKALAQFGNVIFLGNSREPLCLDVYAKVDVILDCSFPNRHTLSSEIKDYLYLLEERVALATNLKVPFIYMASFSSSPNVKSRYGQGKFQAEEIVVGRGGLLCRFGILVDVDNPRGIFASLVRFSSYLPFLPRFSKGWFLVDFTYLSDLTTAICERLCSQDWDSFSVISGRSEICDLVRLVNKRKRILTIGKAATRALSFLISLLPKVHPIDSLKSINKKV